MERFSYDEEKTEKKVTPGGYIYSENKYLEALVLKIREAVEGERARKHFREILSKSMQWFYR